MAFKMTKPTFGKSPLKQGELEKMDQPKVKEAGLMGVGKLPNVWGGLYDAGKSIVKGVKKAAKTTDKTLKKEAKKQSKTKATRNFPTGSKL